MLKQLLTGKFLSIGVASVIAVGVLGAASIAVADEPASPSASGQQELQGVQGSKHWHGLIAGAILKDAGVTKDELKQGATEGKTFGEIITAYGSKSVAQEKTDALAALDKRVTEAVTAGKLTQAQADKIKAEAPAAFDKFMAAKPGDHKPSPAQGKIAAIGKDALQTVAETIGITPEELKTQLAGGKSIAEIAGPKTDAVIAALTTKANTAIDKAIADGKLTADQGATAKTKAAEAITKFVNATHPIAKGLHAFGRRMHSRGK